MDDYTREQIDELLPTMKRVVWGLAFCLLVAGLALGGWYVYSSTPGARSARVHRDFKFLAKGLAEFNRKATVFPLAGLMVSEPPRSVEVFLKGSNRELYVFAEFELLAKTCSDLPILAHVEDPYGHANSVYGYSLGLVESNEFDWVLVSLGPDRRANVPLADFRNPEDLMTRLVDHVYDPSNGLTSSGDIVLTRMQHRALNRPFEAGGGR